MESGADGVRLGLRAWAAKGFELRALGVECLGFWVLRASGFHRV